MEKQPAPATPDTSQSIGESNRPRIDSQQLLRGTLAVEIEHAGQCYLLRVTRENKLILTK